MELMEESSSMEIPNDGLNQDGVHFPGAVKKIAYGFDGFGNYFSKDWDLNKEVESCRGREFYRYHMELPKGNQKLAFSAQHLIKALSPPLKLQEILTLTSNGPFCGYVDGALGSGFTLKIVVKVSENSIITVSLGRVPRLGFSPIRESLLSEIPRVECPGLCGNEGKTVSGGTVI